MHLNSPFKTIFDQFDERALGELETDFNAAKYWNEVSAGRIKARYISPFAIILCTPEGIYPSIGEGTWIGHFCVIDGSGGLTIGENCDIASGAHIYTHSTVKRCIFKGLKEEPKEVAPVVIGNHVFIGPNSVIGHGSSIGSRYIVFPTQVVSPYTNWPSVLKWDK